MIELPTIRGRDEDRAHSLQQRSDSHFFTGVIHTEVASAQQFRDVPLGVYLRHGSEPLFEDLPKVFRNAIKTRAFSHAELARP